MKMVLDVQSLIRAAEDARMSRISRFLGPRQVVRQKLGPGVMFYSERPELEQARAIIAVSQ